MLLAELTGLGSKLSRRPAGKRNLLFDVSSRSCVFLLNLRKMVTRKSLGNAYESGPKASMYVGNLATNKPADEHIGAVSDSAG
jgi:hypothetical protein